jgi:hypothetical protein
MFDTSGYTIDRRGELTAVIKLPKMDSENGNTKQIVVSVRQTRDDKFATSSIYVRDYNPVTKDAGTMVGANGEYVANSKMTASPTAKNMKTQFELMLSGIDTHLEHITKFYNEQSEAIL